MGQIYVDLHNYARMEWTSAFRCPL